MRALINSSLSEEICHLLSNVYTSHSGSKDFFFRLGYFISFEEDKVSFLESRSTEDVKKATNMECA